MTTMRQRRRRLSVHTLIKLRRTARQRQMRDRMYAAAERLGLHDALMRTMFRNFATSPRYTVEAVLEAIRLAGGTR